MDNNSNNQIENQRASHGYKYIRLDHLYSNPFSIFHLSNLYYVKKTLSTFKKMLCLYLGHCYEIFQERDTQHKHCVKKKTREKCCVSVELSFV